MIDKSQLQRLNDLPIEGVAQRLGLYVSRHRCLCPFHDDSHPSLTFHARSNRFRCFVCGENGGPIDLVMKLQHLRFPEACRWLADGTSMIISQHPPRAASGDDGKGAAFDAGRYLRFFEYPRLSEAACRFLYQERHLDPRVVRWCRITSWRDRNGYDWLQTPYYDVEGKLIGVQNRNLRGGPSRPEGPSRPPLKGGDRTVKDVAEENDVTEENRLEREDQTVKDVTENKDVTEENRLERGEKSPFKGDLEGPLEGPGLPPPRFRFPYGSRCGIYNLPILKLLKPGEPLFITEGCSDCWAMLSAGHKAIAIPSATLLKPDDIQLLRSWSSKLGTTFHMYPDQDEPGERLFLQLRDHLSSQYGGDGGRLQRHQLPSGCKDFGEYYRKKKDIKTL